MPYFAESTPISRLVLAVLGILAIVVISLAVKDYVVQRKDATRLATTSSSSATSSDAEKKNESTKKRRARMNAVGANAPATDQAGVNGMEKERRDQLAAATATDNANPAEDETAQADRNSRLFAASAWPDLLATECYPLPNLTKPEDVDAPYYQNWAKEYCGK